MGKIANFFCWLFSESKDTKKKREQYYIDREADIKRMIREVLKENNG